jgi:hypothetical protein
MVAQIHKKGKILKYVLPQKHTSLQGTINNNPWNVDDMKGPMSVH